MKKDKIEEVKAWYCDHAESVIIVVDIDNGDYFETEIELNCPSWQHVPEGC